MAKIAFEAKQSKLMLILACIACGIFEIVWGGMLIFIIATWSKGLRNDYFAYIFMLCFFVILFLAFIGIFIYLIINYKRQIDVYTGDKVYRKKGKKVIFELPYNQIETVREGFHSIFLVLKKGIVKKSGKKGPRNFYEHYAEKDIYEIEKIISSYKTYNSK